MPLYKKEQIRAGTPAPMIIEEDICHRSRCVFEENEAFQAKGCNPPYIKATKRNCNWIHDFRMSNLGQLGTRVLRTLRRFKSTSSVIGSAS